MYTKLLEGQIIFYYPHTDLFEDVQHLSAYMCKNIVSKEGEDLSERFIITADEEPVFRICLREALPSLYETVRVLTHGIADAFYDEITGAGLKALDSSLSTLAVGDTADYVAIRTVDNGAYNPNEVRLVDSTLLSAIEEGVLSQFYNRVTHETLTQMSAAQYAAQNALLARRILGLRKKSVI